MGLSVVVQTEASKVLKRLDDPKNVLHRVLPHSDDTTFTCLRFVDWYGDTVFNSLQMQAIEEELDRLADKSVNEEDKEMLARLNELVRYGQSRGRSFLKFIGD